MLKVAGPPVEIPSHTHTKGYGMKKKWWIASICLLATGFLGSCTMSDQDRCPGGFVYQSQYRACAPTDAAPVQPDAAVAAPTPEVDATASEAAAASGPSFGSTCNAATDCTSASTDYCVKMPTSTAGYCSKMNCAADCPTDYKCCNCAAFGMVACLKSADATQVAAYGCRCS